jgi:hypothetical protein
MKNLIQDAAMYYHYDILMAGCESRNTRPHTERFMTCRVYNVGHNITEIKAQLVEMSLSAKWSRTALSRTCVRLFMHRLYTAMSIARY